MATKLYLHAASSPVSGTLPSAEQSTLTAFDNFESDQSANRLMDRSIGLSQTSLANSSNNSTSLRDYYVARWVSLPLAVASISANTWTYNFAAAESNANANFPVSGTNQPVYVNIYIWRPSDGTKVGTILDGNTASAYDEPGGTSSERVMHGTFSGGSVGSLANGDVLVIEMWFRITQAMAVSYTDTVYFDGTTENTTENATVSNHASFIETPQNLGFIFSRQVNETLTLTDQATRELTAKRSVAQTLTLNDAATVEKINRRAVNETLTLTDDADRELTAKRAANQTLSLSDQATRELTAKRTTNQSLTLTDDADAFKTVPRNVNETLGLTDDAQRELTAKRSATASLTLTDEATRELTAKRTTNQSLTLTDDAEGENLGGGGGQLFQRSVNESLDLVDEATRELTAKRAANQTLGLTDQATRELTAKRSVGQSLTLTDDAQSTRIVQRFVNQSLTLTDDAQRALEAKRQVNQALSLSDQAVAVGSGEQPEVLPTLDDLIASGRHITPKVTKTKTDSRINLQFSVSATDQLGLVDVATVRVIRASEVLTKLLKEIRDKEQAPAQPQEEVKKQPQDLKQKLLKIKEILKLFDSL